MKRLKCIIIIFIITYAFSAAAQKNCVEDFTFIAAADMRYYATERYHDSQHFLGALQAMKKIGAGALMITPGDADPPHAVRELVSAVLGEDYPWYLAAGNHDFEDDSYIDWMRQYNRNGTSLPNIIRKGPKGCEETTYSFDWNDCHFVALNVYFDGEDDYGTDGEIVPELLQWLETDLEQNQKKYIFVFGHEPIISIPDMDSGRIRHQGDSLDQYPSSTLLFHKLLLKYGVTAYICGHTHSASFTKINGLWQIDVGHCRGIEEDAAPEILFGSLSKSINSSYDPDLTEEQIIREYFESNKNQVKKTLYHLRIANVDSYKKIADEIAVLGLLKLYSACKDSEEERTRHINTFWRHCDYRGSTFVKFYVSAEQVKAEFYRDDARGGKYSLRKTINLR